jgi:cholest-4-en-3-one 26-monooxygenase
VFYVAQGQEEPVQAPDVTARIDLLDPDLLSERVPFEELAELRRTAPVSWYPTDYHAMGFDDAGYWIVTRHADMTEISRRSDVFSSFENGAIARFQPEMERENIEVQRFLMLNQDPPQHTATRRIVSRGFTPRAIESLRTALTDRARRIVEEAHEKGSGDFVTDVACELPLQAICELIGVPQEDRHKVFEWSNQMVGADDPDFANVDPTEASANMLGYAWQMAEQRRACPMDDIATKLLTAELDGALDDQEFSFFVLLLAVAGNETTRNAISHGMNAFFDHPEQWELYKQTRPRTAPDEIVRWATPIHAFQRTAIADTQVGGVDVAKGDRVVMFYSSANRDPDVFENPETFDIMRDPNPHLGFGGLGTHYCLGANLARVEIDLIFNAVADVMPDVRKLEPPRRLRAGWINGIKELKVAYT